MWIIEFQMIVEIILMEEKQEQEKVGRTTDKGWSQGCNFK